MCGGVFSILDSKLGHGKGKETKIADTVNILASNVHNLQSWGWYSIYELLSS